jgi:iron complex transport system ATP-binding protein
MLKANNIHYSAGGKKILKGITAQFEPGLFHVILGPNGSGKSSFLKIFSGELRPQSGEIFYADRNIAEIDKTTLAQRRAVMSQHPELQFPLSVEEVVMMGRYPHFGLVPSDKDRKICAEVLDSLQICSLSGRDYLSLSGGEKQRVQFARVLAQLSGDRPESLHYLFLDEPISSLDIYYQHQFLQMIKQLLNKQLLVIAILHDLNIALQYADRLCFIKEGSVAAMGSPLTIVTASLIKKIFDIPVRILNESTAGRPIIVYDGA